MRTTRFFLVIAIIVGIVLASCKEKDENITIQVTGVSLNKSALTLIVGDSETLIATVTPENAENMHVIWSSNTTGVATVDAMGKVTAISEGEAIITVATVEGGKIAACNVTVNPVIIAVTGVTLNKNTLTLTVGDTETFFAFIEPENADNKSVTWSSSAVKIATIDENGKVTALQAGTSTITVTTIDGGKTSDCTLTILEPQIEIYAVDISEETDWDYMIFGNDGSSVFINLDSQSYIPTQLFYRPYKNSDDGFSVFLKENGMPKTMVIKDYIIVFGNFNGTQFDMALINPDKSIEYFYNVNTDVDWNTYSEMSQMNVFKLKSNMSEETKIALIHGLKYVGNTLSTILCYVGAVTSPTGIGALGLLGCGATFVSVINDYVLPKYNLDNFGIGLSSAVVNEIATLIQCATRPYLCLANISANTATQISMGLEYTNSRNPEINQASSIIYGVDGRWLFRKYRGKEIHGRTDNMNQGVNFEEWYDSIYNIISLSENNIIFESRKIRAGDGINYMFSRYSGTINSSRNYISGTYVEYGGWTTFDAAIEMGYQPTWVGEFEMTK